MLIIYNAHNDNRRSIQDAVAHIIDNCVPLIDENVSRIIELKKENKNLCLLFLFKEFG